VISDSDQSPRKRRAGNVRPPGPVPWARPYVQAQPRPVLHGLTPRDPDPLTPATNAEARTDPVPPLLRTHRGLSQGAADTQHRSILMVDIEGYSRPSQTNRTRGRLRSTLYRLLEMAIWGSGIPANQLEPASDQGDGALLLFHPEVPKNRLLCPLMADLADGLTDHNRRVPECERLRLRAVVHAGELLRDDHGWFGEDLDQAFSLVNSDTLRACLAETSQPLVLLVTDQIYCGIVKQELAGIDPSTCEQVHASVKRGQIRAWVHIPR
jgi:class 3 adenylate cyclase